jgi:hypothetical protein
VAAVSVASRIRRRGAGVNRRPEEQGALTRLLRQLGEALILADGGQVFVGRHELLDALVDLGRPPEVLNRLVGASRPCREAPGVDVRHRIVRPLLDDDGLLDDRGLVVACAVSDERLAGFLRRRLVRLARSAAETRIVVPSSFAVAFRLAVGCT